MSKFHHPLVIVFFFIAHIPLFSQVQLSELGLNTERFFSNKGWVFENENGELSYLIEREAGEVNIYIKFGDMKLTY